MKISRRFVNGSKTILEVDLHVLWLPVQESMALRAARLAICSWGDVGIIVICRLFGIDAVLQS